jgi:hypothetical protein
MRSELVFAFFLPFCVGIFSLGVTNVAAQGCMAGGCHPGLAGAKYLHGPVAAEMAGANGCEMCHLASGVKCAVGRGGIFKLKNTGLCVACHAKGAGTKHSAKETEAKCLRCHVPHGSDRSRHLLRPERQ